MPFGLLLLLAFSLLIFRRARRKGRSGILWVVLLWGCCFGLAFIAALVTAVDLMLLPGDEIDEAGLRRALLLPVGAGLFVGALVPLIVITRVPSKVPTTDFSESGKE